MTITIEDFLTPPPTIPLSYESNVIYQALLLSPRDKFLMNMLGDKLKEEGHEALGYTYQWAAEKDKWPFHRSTRKNDMHLAGYKRVYDWDSVDREPHPIVPDCAKLPHIMFLAIKKLVGRKYGGVMEAFIILSQVLPRAKA